MSPMECEALAAGEGRIRTPAAIFGLLRGRLECELQEVFVVASLDTDRKSVV